MVIYLSLLVAIGGLIMWLGCKPKWDTVGQIMFLCGLLAFLLGYHGQGIKFLQ